MTYRKLYVDLRGVIMFAVNDTNLHDGWKDYLYWQTEDRKTLKKINSLIDDENVYILTCRYHYSDT